MQCAETDHDASCCVAGAYFRSPGLCRRADCTGRGRDELNGERSTFASTYTGADTIAYTGADAIAYSGARTRARPDTRADASSGIRPDFVAGPWQLRDRYIC